MGNVALRPHDELDAIGQYSQTHLRSKIATWRFPRNSRGDSQRTRIESDESQECTRRVGNQVLAVAGPIGEYTVRIQGGLQSLECQNGVGSRPRTPGIGVGRTGAVVLKGRSRSF